MWSTAVPHLTVALTLLYPYLQPNPHPALPLTVALTLTLLYP